MALGKPLNPNSDLTRDFNSNYNITLDVSNWDTTTFQAIAPMSGTVFVYGTNDSGALESVRDGDATLATNFTPIQAVNLATGSAVGSFSAAGLYKVTNGAQFLRFQGNPATTPTNIYRIRIFQSKIS
jgi:hypothetical protein